MLKILTLIFAVCCSCLAVASDAPYNPGETIHFHINQMGIKAGEATLVFQGPQQYKGKDTLLIVFTADGFNFYDKEEIYVDPKNFRPLFVERSLNIFGKKEKISEEYLNAEHKIKISKQADGKTADQILDTKGDVENLYGFIYRYRKEGSFKKGDIIKLNLPTQSIKIALTKNRKFSAAGKDYDSFYMESNPSKYKIWFDVGPKKLPLRISGAVGIANSVMTMTDVKE